jgi:hypothetical protein
MSPARPALLQSAALGLSAGALLGAIYLVVKAVILTHTDCPAPASAEDCALESQIADDLSSFLYFAAVGLALISAGVFVIFRPKKDGVA